MGRRLLFDRPLTVAERVRRFRANHPRPPKETVTSLKKQLTQAMTEIAALKKQLARRVRKSNYDKAPIKKK